MGGLGGQLPDEHHNGLELALNDLSQVEREAALATEQAGFFVYEFANFFCNEFAYRRLNLNEEQAEPLREIIDTEQIQMLIMQADESPLRRAIYQCTAAQSEGKERQPAAFLDWRLDLQYPSGMEIVLPDLEGRLYFLFMKQKPTDAPMFNRLLNGEMPERVQTEVRNDGERVYLSVQKRTLLTKGTAKVPYFYLGEFGDGQPYHAYGNGAQAQWEDMGLRVPKLLRRPKRGLTN